ncbi:MAG TPA: M15 family metallopeptidase [Alphaproteobacteria bacterium]|nr:M15 family metallopeptidase [Alphaproteobacteria bacterium]
MQPSERYFRKMASFDDPHPMDVVAPDEDFRLLQLTLRRIKRVQKLIGYGNFNILSFDEMLKIGRSHISVERFTSAELAYLEKLFYADASSYGFYGAKVLNNLTDDVDRNRTAYVRGTGQRIFRGPALERYQRVKRAVGSDLVLTSGVRSIVKQLYLFMNKAERANGNLSLASRSLAPPGYSFHAIGDFDVGKRGLGGANFTDAFASTDVYRRLVDLGFVKIRYPQRNLLGVRFEPWHIRVA